MRDKTDQRKIGGENTIHPTHETNKNYVVKCCWEWSSFIESMHAAAI